MITSRKNKIRIKEVKNFIFSFLFFEHKFHIYYQEVVSKILTMEERHSYAEKRDSEF